MKKAITLFLIIAILCVITPSYAQEENESIVFTPTFVSGMNLSAHSWTETSGNCAMLSALMMMDFEAEFNVKTSKKLFTFDVYNDTFVGTKGTFVYIGYYNDDSVLFVLYETSSKSAGCIIRNTTKPDFVAQYIIETECENYQQIDGVEIYRMLIIISDALEK